MNFFDARRKLKNSEKLVTLTQKSIINKTNEDEIKELTVEQNKFKNYQLPPALIDKDRPLLSLDDKSKYEEASELMKYVLGELQNRLNNLKSMPNSLGSENTSELIEKKEFLENLTKVAMFNYSLLEIYNTSKNYEEEYHSMGRNLTWGGIAGGAALSLTAITSIVDVVFLNGIILTTLGLAGMATGGALLLAAAAIFLTVIIARAIDHNLHKSEVKSLVYGFSLTQEKNKGLTYIDYETILQLKKQRADHLNDSFYNNDSINGIISYIDQANSTVGEIVPSKLSLIK